MALVILKEDNFLDEQQWPAVTNFAMTQYSYKKALDLFPGRAKAAVGKELDQLHSRNAFVPQERQKKMALEPIMIVKDKCDESLKGRFCTDGQKQRGTMEKDESTSPIVGIDSVFIFATIEAAKGRDVAVVDLPGSYLSANMNIEEEVRIVF